MPLEPWPWEGSSPSRAEGAASARWAASCSGEGVNVNGRLRWWWMKRSRRGSTVWLSAEGSRTRAPLAR